MKKKYVKLEVNVVHIRQSAALLSESPEVKNVEGSGMGFGGGGTGPARADEYEGDDEEEDWE